MHDTLSRRLIVATTQYDILKNMNEKRVIFLSGDLNISYTRHQGRP